MGVVQPEVRAQDIGDADIQYLHYASEGPPLVMLHATGLLPWMWHPIAGRLASRFRVIAPYFCDHRAFEPEEGGVNWRLLASDLACLCERLSLEKPLLVGHSMGATVVAIATVEHGIKADRMALIEPIFLPQSIYASGISVEQHPLASRSIKRRNAWSTDAEARDYLRSKSMFARWDEEMMDLYIRYGMASGDGGGLTLACHPRREAALFMGGLQFDPWPVLPRIQCPVLVIEGETSDNRHFIDLPKITSLIPNGRYRLVKDAGHLLVQEQPKETLKILSDFFKE
jgi:lipase